MTVCHRIKIGLCLLAVLVLVAGGCKEKSEASRGAREAPGAPAAGAAAAPGTAAAPLSAGFVAPEGYPYDGKPLYRVGQRPVTDEELRRYSARMLGLKEHGENPVYHPDNVVKSFARYWTVVEMGRERKMEKDPAVTNVVRVYGYAAAANDYRANLEKSYVVPDADLKAALPADWTRMEFGMSTFSDPAEAEKFHEDALKKKGALGKAEFAKFAAEAFRSRTGQLYRGSGFFAESEERYLFGLAEGDVSRPVATGIGTGVCYVVRKETVAGKAREELIEKSRGVIRSNMVSARIAAIAEKSRYTVNKENVDRAVAMEGTTGVQSDRTVLTLHGDEGDIPISYRDFRNLVPSNYSVYFRTFPPETWVANILPEVKNLALLYALGREAVRQGTTVDPKWKKELFDFRWKTVYLATIERMAKEAEVAVSAGEMEKFYKSNRGLFDRKETVLVRYVYAPEREGLRQLLKQAGSPEKLFSAKEYRDLVKARMVVQGDSSREEFFKALRSVKAGAISDIFKADMGYYIVKLEERREKGYAPYADVREQIRDYLTRQKKDEKVRAAIDTRLAGTEIRKI